MKKFIVAIAALITIAMSVPANAADMYVKADQELHRDYDWSGVYLGTSVGWMSNRFSWAYTNPAPVTCCAPFNMRQNDFVLGGHGGIQGMWGRVVLGIQADIMMPGANSNGFAGQTGCIAHSTQTCEARLGQISTAGGKLGWAFDTWLPYVKGGWAAGSVDSKLVNASGSAFDSTNVLHRNGWFVGAGLDWVMHKGTIVDVISGIDYQHVDLRTQFHASSADGFSSAPPGVNGRNIGATSDIIRASLTIKTKGWEIFAAPARN